jgi:hypothetical protein
MKTGPMPKKSTGHTQEVTGKRGHQNFHTLRESRTIDNRLNR